MSSSKSSKLFLANISSKVRKRDIEDTFEKFGKIVDITLKEGRDRFAFIEYDDVRDAEDALDK
jgi:RNA recognition motif-containing protein